MIVGVYLVTIVLPMILLNLGIFISITYSNLNKFKNKFIYKKRNEILKSKNERVFFWTS